MRLLVLLVLGSVLGGLGGWWQSSNYKTLNEAEVGDQNFTESDKQTLSNLADQNKNASLVDSVVITEDMLPRVEVEGGTDFDFGTMKRGTERSHEFIFKNTGNAPMELRVESSTCKCTVGSVTEEAIAPGASAPVKLTWKAEGIQNDFAQTATITTTDPRMREVKLTVTGRIGTNYIYEPDTLTLGEFSSTETISRTFKVFSMEDTELKVAGYWGDLDMSEITEVKSDIKKLEKGADPSHADARWVADVTFTIKPGMPAGPINGQVRLMVGPEETRQSIPVSGKCVSDLRIIASQGYDEEKNLLELGTFDRHAGGESIIFWVAAVSDKTDLALKVAKISPNSFAGVLKTEIGEPKKTNRRTLFPVKLIIPPGSPAVDLDGANPQKYGVIDFESNIENAGKISLFLRIVVK